MNERHRYKEITKPSKIDGEMDGLHWGVDVRSKMP
jgi:hypothetical protein